MPPPPSSWDGCLGGGRAHKGQGTPASQPLVPKGAKFNFAFAFGASDGYLGLRLVYRSLHMEFKHELIVDNAIHCLCLKASLESKRIPF